VLIFFLFQKIGIFCRFTISTLYTTTIKFEKRFVSSDVQMSNDGTGSTCVFFHFVDYYVVMIDLRFFDFYVAHKKKVFLDDVFVFMS